MATFAQSFKILNAYQPLAASGSAVQNIDTVSTVQVYPLGTRVLAQDPVLGISEFVYGVGVASTVLGDSVLLYGNFTTLRDSGTNMKGQIAVAAAALVASTYGWYCVKGRCLVSIFENCTALDAYFADATSGAVGVSVVATNHVVGMGLAAGLLAGGSAIVGTTDTTPANQTVCHMTYPTVALAV